MGQEAKESGASYELLNAFQGMIIFFISFIFSSVHVNLPLFGGPGHLH